MTVMTYKPQVIDGGNTTTSRTTVLRETTTTYWAKTKREFGSSSETAFKSIVTVDDFLDYVAAERLRRMPHRGSKWDKVLQWAAYFASQTQLFQKSTSDIVSHSEEAARLIWSNCRLLLELGPDHIDILEKIFALFYNMASTLSFFHRNSEFFVATAEVQHALATVFSDLVKLVVDVTAQYGQPKSTAATVSSTEFYSEYRVVIDSIYLRRDQISNYMWAYAVVSERGQEHYDYSIETIRAFLAPADRIVRSLTTARVRGYRAEYTCEWFQSHLFDFTRSKDKLMLVTGKAGCGKSFLSGWISERLLRAEGRNAHDVISYRIDQDMKSQATNLAVAKGLLLQLMDRNIGDIHLYEAVVKAIEQSAHAKSSDEIEEHIWGAVKVALQHEHSNFMVIVDGLDALQGGEATGQKLLERLFSLSSGHSHVKSIVLSTPLSKAAPQQARGFTIETTHVKQDIEYYLAEVLSSTTAFRRMKSEDRSKIVQRISSSADGSYVWANVALEFIKKERSVQDIFGILDSLPKSLNEMLKKLMSHIDLQDSDTRSLLAWLLAAERPLSLPEIKLFSEIDLGTCSYKQRFSEVEDDVVRAVGSVVDITDGIVRFKHSTIRQYFNGLALSVKDYSNTGDFPFMLKEAHYDLSTRCLAYIKIFLTRRAEPSFQPLTIDSLTEVFESFTCLEYAATYWISHFDQSPMYDPSGKHRLVPEFRNCFPDSTLLALIEASTWKSFNYNDYELALFIRKTILGEKTLAVLQTTITLARTVQLLQMTQKASQYFYESYQLTQTLLSSDSEILVFCAAGYLSVTSTTTITEKTEIATRREEMFKYVIKHYRETYGVSNDITVRYIKMLAQLYTDTKQYDFAATTWKEVYEIYIEKYGQFATETTTVYKTLISVYEKSSKKEEITTISQSHYESTTRSVEVTEEKKTSTALDMIKSYEGKRDVTKAEEVFVNLWRSTTEKASTSRSIEDHERKIEITKKYADFLQRNNRKEEAETILTGLWSEYQSSEMIKSESVMKSFKSVAEQMRSMQMFSSARSVFSSMYEYFKSSSTSTTETSEIHRQLTETTQEMVEQTSREISTATSTATSTSTSTSTTVVSEESKLEEAFTAIMSLSTTSTTTEVQTTIAKTSQRLSSLYFKQSRWSECFRVCTQSLSILWQGVMTRTGKATLTTHLQTECLEIATRMAECCFKEHQIEKTEEIYSYLFYACMNTLKFTDALVYKQLTTLITFYETTYRFTKAVTVYGEYYKTCKVQMGETNKRTVEIAYEIGDFCERHYRFRDAEPYYWDVFTILTKNSETITTECVRAAKNLVIIYETDGRWETCETVCKKIWATWTTKSSTEIRFEAEFIEKVYNVYLYILEEVKKVSYEEIYKFTKTYHETCTRVFGERHELTIKATLKFAEVCERSESHHEESISLYEKVTKHSETLTAASTAVSTAVIVSVIATAKHKLARLYSKKTTSSTSTATSTTATSSTAKSTSATTSTSTTSTTTSSSRAIALYQEELQSKVSSYGYSDERSLETITEMTSQYASQNKTESTTTAVQMLQTAVVEIITKERNTTKLTKSATTIAESYKKLSRTETAWELLTEIRRQVITGDYSSNNKFKISLKGVDRKSFTFIIAFQQAISTTKTSFSELMSELMTETTLYQAYMKVVKENSSFETIFDQGSRLAVFYQARKRTEEYNRTWNELYEFFATYMKASKQSTTLREFFELCVAEMSHSQYEATIVQTGSDRVLAKMQQSKFAEAYDIAYYVDRFVHLHGGWRSQQMVEAGLQICLHLTGRSGTNKATDQKLHAQILELCGTVLREVLRAAKDLNIHFIRMPVKQINSIVGLLSEQQDYNSLEWILAELWQSRFEQTSWDSVTIVWIGRRLVEVRFAVGKRAEAIRLCEDITYNLRRVWGPTDKTTLEMFDLLIKLYNTAGEPKKAIYVNQDILRQTLTVVNDEELPTEQGADVAQYYLDQLKVAYVRNGGFGNETSTQEVQELVSSVQNTLGKEKTFKPTCGVQVEKWSTKDKVGDQGTWVKPQSFEFIATAEGKHVNNLRKTSGLVSYTRGLLSKRYSSSSSAAQSSSTTTATTTTKTTSVNGA